MAPIRVVIADDAAGLRRLLCAVLSRDPGFEVVGEAGNGAEAVVAVSRTRPDVVLLDLAMPVMDGLEALPKITGVSPGTRVVVLSGFDAGQMEDEARALGAHAYLTKGLSPDELVAALRRAVHGRGHPGTPGPVTAHGEERETLLQTEDRFRLLLDEVVDYAIVMLDPDGMVASWNTGAHRITGHAAADVLGRHLRCFYPRAGAEPDLAERDLAEARERGRLETEGTRVRADGSRFWASCVVTLMRDDAGGLRGYAVVFHDISARRAAEQALETMASTDPLTGLPNRREFESRMAAVGRRRFAVLAIDLDHLKALNDGYGHETGDEALRVTARALRMGVRENDVVARVGGDEFAALLPDLTEAEALAAAERLRLGMHGVSVQRGQARISVGVASGEAGADPGLVLAAADEALYAAKAAGRDRCEVPSAGDGGSRRLGVSGWASVLDGLVAGSGMLSVFQPVVDLVSGRTAGYEALGRPAAGGPDADVEPLFAAAERLGYGRDLDWLCRRVALGEARTLPAGSTVFVNVGVSALLDPVHDVDQMLLLVGWAGRSPAEVVLEITEREIVLDLPRLGAVLAAYRRHGFRFAVDDVGEGHSTLEMLAAAVPEYLKISGRITRAAVEVGARSAIRAIVAFAAESGARVVAEGIETGADLQRMRDLGVELGQGFGLQRPAPAAAWANGWSVASGFR